MSLSDKHIVDTYATLLQGLSTSNKIELIESLSKSLKQSKKLKEDKFFKSFGAFASKKSPRAIMADIKASRKFKSKRLKF